MLDSYKIIIRLLLLEGNAEMRITHIIYGAMIIHILSADIDTHVFL